jgi:hypothetical protein
MTKHIAQSPEQVAQEIEFWRDFIHWWEHKYGHPAGARVLAALAAAESRYNTAAHGRQSEQGSTSPALNRLSLTPE